MPDLGPGPVVLPSPILLTSPAAAFQRADRLVRLEQRLIVAEHRADGFLGARSQLLGPHPGWRLPDMVGAVAAIKPGQAAVNAPEAQIGAEKGKTDGGFAQQGREQRRVRDIHTGHPRLRYRCVSTHRTASGP